LIAWDDYWKTYVTSKAERWMILERDKIINEYISRIHAKKKKVMEVGCGFGSNLRLIHLQRKDAICYALDFSTRSTLLVRQEISCVVQSYCRSSPFINQSFDLIYSAGLMEHLEESSFLDEMKRILKGGGILITFVPARISLWKLYILLHFRSWKHGFERSYTYQGLHDLFLKNGWQILDIRGIDPFSVNGFVMKLLNISFAPFLKKSFCKSGYTELCVISKKWNSF